MAKDTKRTKGAREAIDRNAEYELTAAVKMVKDAATAKFDETIEVAMSLNVDPRHADQMVRGVVQLPNGTGKNVRVAVFANRFPICFVRIYVHNPIIRIILTMTD